MNNLNPFLASDGYKTSHYKQYPKGTTLVYSNFTPRSNRHGQYVTDAEGKPLDYVISFGQQMIMQQIKELFDKEFFVFSKEMREYFVDAAGKQSILDKKNEICGEIKREYSLYLNTDYDVSHIEALWDLGYLPIAVKALPEGTKVPMGIPLLTIWNTLDEFYWLTNFLETIISNLLWKPITSATIAHSYKLNLLKWAEKTDKENLEFINFQGHDFSMRGMDSLNASITSGLGHATSFLGSDSMPVIYGARKYYKEKGFVVGSVNATEHSVMSAGGDKNELDTFRYLMKQFPTGILSIVSDTWNLWDVLTKYLPELKGEILARDGKIVIRPDSGDPVEIICGNHLVDNITCIEPYERGVIQLLWDIFGGTVNEQGYKVLDSHIGAIYGDSITLERANDICSRLEAKGFASTNIVLGIGSYTYQYNTRDTFGFAMKATYVEIEENWEAALRSGNGSIYSSSKIGRNIFKDPITDDGAKKSAKGLLCVNKNQDYGHYELDDEVEWNALPGSKYGENKGHLQTIFRDNKVYNQTTLSEIRSRIN